MNSRIIVWLALMVLAITLGPMRGAPALADEAGNPTTGRVIQAGKWAYIVPPTALQGDHENVMVSAPREEWTVGGGPYDSEDACEHSRTLATSEANGELSAATANAYANPVAQAAARTYENQGMDQRSALEQAVQEITWREKVLALKRRNSKCEQSDGSARFRVPPEVKRDPNAPYQH